MRCIPVQVGACVHLGGRCVDCGFPELPCGSTARHRHTQYVCVDLTRLYLARSDTHLAVASVSVRAVSWRVRIAVGSRAPALGCKWHDRQRCARRMTTLDGSRKLRPLLFATASRTAPQSSGSGNLRTLVRSTLHMSVDAACDTHLPAAPSTGPRATASDRPPASPMLQPSLRASSVHLAGRPSSGAVCSCANRSTASGVTCVARSASMCNGQPRHAAP